jgi:tetratricopeptide (TPR) repeat protein
MPIDAQHGWNGIHDHMTSTRKTCRTLQHALAVAIALAAGGVAQANTAEEKIILEETVASATLAGSYLAGQVAAKDNDDGAAVHFFRRSLSLDPENPEIKRRLFHSFIANGRIDDAVRLAQESDVVATGSAEAEEGNEGNAQKLVLAVDAIKKKSWARVTDLLDEAQTGELDNLIEQLLGAWAVYGQGDAAGAISATQAILGAEWAVAIRDYHAGLMAAASGDNASAAIYFSSTTQDRAIAGVLTETYLRALEAGAVAQARNGDRDGALETLSGGIELLPQHPPFLSLREQLLAGKPLRPLVTSAPQGAAELFYNVGGAISRQGGVAMAQSFLMFADHLNPQADVISLALAHLFEGQGQHARANSFYERIKPDSPNYRRAQMEYALNLNDMERVDEAKARLRQLIEDDPSDLLAYSTLGGLLSQHKEYAEAARAYDRAVAQIDKEDESHWSLYYRRGIAYERLKEWEKAEPSFRRSLELDPDQADVLNYLGYSWVDMGMNLDAGMDMIRKAVELKPRSGYIVDSLGWAYYKLGRYEDAVRELERAVEIMPEDPVINDHLGDAYWRVGRRLEATFQWNHALANDPELEDKVKIRQKLNKGLAADDKATAASEK